MTLRELRSSRHLSQGAVARRMGISRPAVTRIEMEGSAPTATLKAYADALEVEFVVVAQAALVTYQLAQPSLNGN